ncbi:FG-GAP-like repeat-containing protein [Ekhidna sp.]|uniref:FG-GAP-like repeat-containing protein n=1 Tax=Ekhidna sp. TaxID=2608089 RepID=UPI003B51339F
MNIYHLTLRATKEKYLKFKHRLEKSISSGSFDKLSRKDKNSRIARVEKLRSRLENYSLFKKSMLAAGSAAFIPTMALSQVIALPPPDPELRFEKGEFDLNQSGSNVQIEVVNIDSDSDLEVLLSTTSAGFIQQREGAKFEDSSPPSLQNMTEEFFIGDIDGDLDIDIVFKNGNYFFLAFNDGDGNFELTSQAYYYSASSTPGAIGRETSAQDVDLVDFDSDGDLDLVIANNGSNLKHFKNDGSGNFSSAGYLSVGSYSGITDFEFANLDGDGDLDLVHNQNNGAYESAVYAKENVLNAAGDPDLSGADAELMYYNYANLQNIVTFDMDGDGDLDVLISESKYSYHLVLENEYDDGASPFSFLSVPLSGFPTENINDVAVSDLNGDGNDDLLLAFSSDSKVGVLEDGTFTVSSNSLNGDIGDATSAFVTVAIGDLDSDGLSDIVGAQNNINDPYIYYDRSAPRLSGWIGDNIIDENRPAGVVGELVFSDFHGDPVTTFGLSGSDASSFTWDAATNELSSNQAFDWEEVGSELDLSLTLSDGIKTRTEKLSVRINNVAEKGHGLLEEQEARLDLIENKYLENFIPVDFDVDGDMDLFYGENYLLTKNDITFTEQWISGFSSGATEVAFADFDLDGDLDLFGKDNFAIYLQENVERSVSSDGWYVFDTYGVGSNSFGLVAGDFDNDGLKEVALIGYSGGSYNFQTIEVSNDGRSGMVLDQDIPLQFSAGGGYMDGYGQFVDIAIADFDGDGNDDLLVITEASGGPGTDAIFLGTPSSGFDTNVTAFTGGDDNGFNRVEVGDFNGDGDPDIAFMRSNGISIEIDVMNNDGTGGFTVGQTLDVGGEEGTGQFDMKLGDMDGDGVLDIVASASDYSDNHSLKMWGNDGAGNFNLLQTISDVSGYEFELMDIDGDDDLDVIVREDLNVFSFGYLNIHFNVNLPATDIALSATSFDEHISEDTQVATISVTDANVTDTHVFTLAAGDGSNDAHNNFFSVNGNNLVLTRDVSTEEFPTLNILLAADDGENIYQQAYTLTVNQVNVAPTAISAPASFDEGTAAGTSIGTLSATDDGVESISFALAIGDGSNDADNGSFIIDGDQLIITEASSFEAKPSYNVYISASDIDGTIEQAFTINVNDLNQAPTGITLSSTTIEENVAAGTAIATLDATDANISDEHEFELVAGDGSNDSDNNKFVIEGDQLIIKQNSSFETQPSYNIYLQASDSEGSVEQAFTITVNNTNSIPTGIQLSSTSFDEGVAGGSSVSTLTADDVDTGDSHTFTLATGDGSNDADNAKFLIDGDQLVIKSSPSFETQSSYNIYLSAADSEGSVEQAVTLTVNNLNSVPTGIQLSSTSFDEGLAGGSSVSTLTADDVDTGDSHTFSLATGDGSNDVDNAKFLIDGDQLVIKSSPSFETQSSYNIYLSAADSEGSVEQAITLTVNNLNSVPTGIQLSSTSFDEGIAGGSSVSTLTADDVDTGDSHTFSLATGDGSNDVDNAKFLIDGDQLVIKSSPSFETQSSYNIYLSAADSEGSVEQAVTLTVNNLNSVPTGIQLSSTSFDEGIAGGSSVSTLTADDVDTGDSHTFSLATGDGTNDVDNAKFLIDGDQLVIKSSPSFETQSSYSIYLSAADSEGSVEQAFVLDVNNINEIPTAISLSSTSLDEDTPAGSAVATIDATDVNASDVHEFALASGDGTNDADNSKFLIEGDQLIIKQNSRFETQASYNIYLSASDAEGSVAQAFVIDVVDVNQAPNSISLSITSLDESVSPGSSAATITATDPNAGDVHTFTLAEGDGTNDAHNDLFVISGDKLILLEAIEFNDLPSISINIQADDGEETFTQVFTLIINEVLGVSDEVSNTLGVYPNPGRERFQINFESTYRGEVSIRVSDLSGKMIHDLSTQKTIETLTYEVDMSGAETGVYIIELISDDEVITQRWVKK